MQFANMPSEKIEKSSNLMLKQFKTMDVDIAQNNSQAELFRSAGENTRTEETNGAEDKTLKDVTASEWIAIFILCFVNLINYMDRFTIAAISSRLLKTPANALVSARITGFPPARITGFPPELSL
ncbi:hypothetical protein WA026_000587 [Henosepilachna vigintioctopunctata]|uniref:Uncharacterized protein n=1 Tax=Henosepilachna vigintioctopunctata TaxID=420089 RepID=A0AAW1V809_9CUCU